MSLPHHNGVLDLDALRLNDPVMEIDAITEGLRRTLAKYRRRGLVVGLSGGIDSSVVAALAVQAVGPKRVLGLMMPEQDSDLETLTLSQQVADWLEVPSLYEDLTPVLHAVGCYTRRDEAFRRAVPGFGAGWSAKLVHADVASSGTYALTSLVAQPPNGEELRARLEPEAYRQAVAATSFKQRVRAMLTYYHADRLHYLVAGTPNRLEYDLGFFVKNGDGAADVKPIAHLLKTQVYQLAETLGVPEEIRERVPTTDTYSLPQRQDEFYFALPYQEMDACLVAMDHGLSAQAAAGALGLDEARVARVFADIDSKRRVAEYLHAAPDRTSLPLGRAPEVRAPEVHAAEVHTAS